MIAYRIHNDATDETTGYYEHEEEARVAVECAREFHQSDDWRAEEVDIVMSPIGFLAELETLRAELAAAQKAHALVCDSLASIQDEQVAPLQAENCRLAAELAEIRLALGLAVHEGFTGEDRTVQELLSQARAEASPPATADGMERLLNAEVQFGLVAQGHIPEIEAMLAEGQDWNEIGAVICWHAGTAKQHYERYLAARAEAKPADGGGE